MDVLELQMPHHHQVIMNHFIEACHADDRVIAAFIGGSYARGAADAYSDLDFGLIITDETYEYFLADREAFIRLLGESVFLEDYHGDGADFVFSIFSDGTEVELALGHESYFNHLHPLPNRRYPLGRCPGATGISRPRPATALRNKGPHSLEPNLGNIAKRSSAAIKAALTRGDSLVLVLEGDCTHAVGAIIGLAQAKRSPGVVWFDAHGDMNTWETTTSGFLGGLPYAVALGWDLDDWRLAAGLEQPVRAEAAALIGASDLDLAEIEALELHPILRMDAVEMVQPGVAKRLQAALQPRATEANAWYLHIDLDVAGPEENPGNLTPATHWPPRQHIIEAAMVTAQTVPVKVASLAVYNPAGDINGRGVRFGLDMAMAIVDGVASRASDESY